ncbi:hypothetical protein Tco_1276170 [Tanacetum coccineum]
MCQCVLSLQAWVPNDMSEQPNILQPDSCSPWRAPQSTNTVTVAANACSGHHPPLSISDPGLHSVYRTAIDSMGHSGSWLSRSSSSRTLPNLTTRSRSSK